MFQLAANMGHPGAKYNLPRLYTEGFAPERVKSAIVNMFPEAADEGLPKAIGQLYNLYEKGEGVPQVEEKAKQPRKQEAIMGLVVIMDNRAKRREPGLVHYKT
jgi:TPR repeat protein